MSVLNKSGVGGCLTEGSHVFGVFIGNFKYLQKEHIERIFYLKYSGILICFSCNNILNLL